jgi:hypothetical protein
MEAKMAKGDNQASNGATEAAATTEGAAASGGDKRAIVLKNGETRADYIRRRWLEKADRSTITKELNSPELNPTPDKKIPYQIVFQATKGQPGGPDPKTEAPAAAAETEGASA